VTRSETHRPIPVGLTLLIAVFSALVALALSGAHHAHAATGASHAAAAQAPVSAASFAIHTDMRRLWEEHVTWTRLAIISLTTDIGNAVKPFYGPAAGDKLTALLRSHILIAADLIAAAKEGDKAGVASEEAAWTANADQIAAFLASANPRFWPVGPMKAMLHDHLRLTTDEVLARLTRHWAADVAAYDKIHLQALHMADMLSNGISRQFPARFR
jgi:hypothetical protein